MKKHFLSFSAVVTFALLYLPLVAIALASFGRTRLGLDLSELTTHWYRKLFSNTPILLSAYHSLLVALFSAVLSTVLGTMLALALWREALPSRVSRFTRLLVELPVITPDILLAVALVLVFGVLRKLSGAFEPGITTLVLAHASYQVSFVTLVVLARLGKIGPEQREAATDLYASPTEAFRRVLFPQILPGIFAAALLSFTLSLDDFIISFFVSGPKTQTLPLLIYGALRRGISPQIHAASTLVVVLTSVGLLLYSLRPTVVVWQRLRTIAFSLVGMLVLSVLGYGYATKSKQEAKRVVTVLLYSEYIDPALLEQFEKETGQEVRLEFYEAQEEMLGKLRASGTAQYDVIVASDVVIPQMIQLELIAPLNPGRLPNRTNLAEEFQKPPFDPEGRYSAAYLWGTTGILHRSSPGSFPSTLSAASSWRRFFEAEKLPGNRVLLDEERSTLSIALAALGRDQNSGDVHDLAAAAELLSRSKHSPQTLGFEGSVSGVQKVKSGQAWAAVVFNGDAAAAMAEDSELQFSIPEEGSSIWVDVMTVSAGAPNPRGAHEFINFLLRPKEGAQLATFVRYGSPNARSLELLEPELLGDETIYPSAETRRRLVFLRDLDRAGRVYAEAWTHTKAD